MNTSKVEVELLRNQAIEAEERRISHIQIFLEELSLDTEVNKTVALELTTAIAFIEQIIEKLKNGEP